jgi:LysM repeat protein
MNTTKYVSWVSIVGLAVIAALGLPSVAAAGPAQQEQNLLQNPGFEGTYIAWNGIPQIQMPAGWTPWWIDNDGSLPDWANQRPEWKPAEVDKYACRVHSGSRAIQWHKSYATFYSGAYQQVVVPANALLRFSVYAQSWSCADYDKCHEGANVWSYDPAKTNMMIGIDPTGGTNPMSPNIVWSAAANPLDAWVYLQVEATAQGGTATVFLLSHPDWPKQNQDAYFDDAVLIVVGSAPAVAPAAAPAAVQPAVAAVAVPPPVALTIATPQPDGSIVHRVEAGDTAWSIAARYGVTLGTLQELNDLGEYIYEGQLLVVAAAQPAAALAEAEPEPDPADHEDSVAALSLAGGGDAPATQEPAPTAQVIAEAPATTTGTLCVVAFDDQNANGYRDSGERLLPGVTIAVMRDQLALGSYTTDGASEPYCFSGLEAGSYRVMQQLLQDWVATTVAAWAVDLRAGDLLDLEFGNVAAQASEPALAVASDAAITALAQADQSSDDTWTRLRSAVFTGGGVLGVLLVIGAAVFLKVSRRRVGA